jgi:GNAT superfamily N-acetyltransferase
MRGVSGSAEVATMNGTREGFDERLTWHLRSWVGAWPPPAEGVHVVGDHARLEPTWDGAVRPLQGVGNGSATVIAVPPAAVSAVAEAIGDDLDRSGLGDELGAILGVGPAAFGAGVFRTTDRVSPDIADLGEWFELQTDDLPEWLAPFNGPRLVAFDDDRPIASVGIKIHDRMGRELSVVTEEAARGRGLARRLVATAARRVLDDGGVPTYLHAPDNTASARVAEEVGFVDRGWTVHGLWPRR